MSTTGTDLNRRGFLKSTAAGLAAAAWPRIARANANERIACGVVGVGGRGSYLLGLLLKREDLDVVSVCDINPDRVRQAQAAVARSGRPQPAGFGERGPDDYRRMLESKGLDAVLVATPMQDHARMAIDALNAGKAVLSEVSAAITLDECWGLVRAVEQTGKLYMMGENVCYYRDLMAVLRMVRAGLFGELTYGECGYVHDCRFLDFAADGSLTWRGRLARDYAGNLYPTHAIGPMAQWLDINGGDRFVSLVAMSTRQVGITHHARNKFGAGSPQAAIPFKKGDTTTALIRTARGAVVELRYDTSSARPHRQTTYHTLQGAKAGFNSTAGEIWIEGRSKDYAWEPLAGYLEEYEHPLWKQFGAAASQTGHGGADYFVIKEFCDALRGGRPAPIDVYDAVTWSAIIPLTAASVARGGEPVEFPHFAAARPARSRPAGA